MKQKIKRKATHLGFIDLAKAYDTVDRTILWEKMRQLGFENDFIEAIKSLYCKDSFFCEVGNIKTSEIYPRL